MIRKTIFWTHLVCGVVAAFAIVTMSFTGVLLTYERQIMAWLERGDYVPEAEQSQRLDLGQLTFIARNEHPELNPSSVTIRNEPGAPISFSGRGRGAPSIGLNPYTGEELQVGSAALDEFFSFMTGFHRWFDLEGENRAIARTITGVSNLIFLFLILSGMYLWLPRLWKWATFKARLLFRGSYSDAKARDFAWHHVFGIWSAIPLAIVVATGAVFSYGWASDLVYVIAGDSPPGAGGGRGPGGADAEQTEVLGSAGPARVQYLSLDRLVAEAGEFIGDWREISVTLPHQDDRVVEFNIDQGNGAQPHLRHTLSLSRASGQVVNHQPFTDASPGRRARSFVRYLHTGEVYGLVGQTIAGLVSLTSLFMVWTGLALAWRRLIQPLLRRRAG